ncbi:MAG: metal-dependent hydrolase [Thermoprotei archaeon]
MYRVVHVFMGFSTGLLLCSLLNNSYWFLCGIMSGIGGYIPDLDLRIKHRKLLHNIIIPLVTITLIYSMTHLVFTNGSNVILLIIDASLLSLLIGWLLHVFCDAFTKRGVYILWPINEEVRVSLTPLKSGELVGNLVVMIIASLEMYYWLRISGYGNLLDKFMEEVLKLFS